MKFVIVKKNQSNVEIKSKKLKIKHKVNNNERINKKKTFCKIINDTTIMTNKHKLNFLN